MATADLSLPIIGNRYILKEQLGAGGMGIVYHATDRLIGQDVALKQVTTPAGQLRFASRSDDSNLHLALAQEFGILASLRHPHIISVLDYGFDRECRPFYTMDLLEKAQTIIQAGDRRPLANQVDLVVQTLQALAYLHRRGVLHRDLKPGNVMVVDSQVKVLDFGLSVISQHSVADMSTTAAGTLAYTAPEILQQQPPSRGSDLYAVGMMACELFAGCHPFDTDNVGALLNQILNVPVDMSAIGVEPELAAWLERLLAKRREERYHNAHEAIRDLCAATGQPLPVETVEIRESYLQAAKFVDRESELAQLTGALHAALDGQGSAWLVGGESGVGKSRLLAEFRTLALVEGAQVLYGQAIHEGGGAYHLWRDIVRWLVLLTAPNDLEAGVLKGVVPDIDDLLDREVPLAPELDPQAAQDRLLLVIEDLLHRQARPLVVVVEDLQWAGQGVKVLAHLARNVDPHPLLLVGTYRDDEKPDLPIELPSMQVLALERFTQERVAELSEAVLGAAGREPPVVDLLKRESLGNPLFLIEIVRSLAEQAGRLAQISSQSLPDVVLVYETRLRHRLERIPQEARPLLDLAAVVGRQLDLDLLRVCEPDADLERWLLTLADAAVLEVQEDGWRFSHDKVREAILDHIAEDARPGLHRRVADALECLYPDAPDRMPALAHHWRLARDTAKERRYAELAGIQALRTGAHDEAILWLERALDLHDVETTSPLELATLRRRLAQACWGQGRLAESRRHSEEALAILGRPLPATSRGLMVDLLKQLGQQALHRLWPDRYLGRSPQMGETLREVAQVYGALGEVVYFNNETALYINLCLRCLNLAEPAGPSPELAQAYASGGLIAGLSPLRFLGDTYTSRAREIARNLEDLPTRALVWFCIGTADFMACRWHRSQSMLEQAVEMARQVGDRHRVAQYLSLLGNVFYYRGLFARSAEVWAEINSIASRRNDVHQQGWSSTWNAVLALRLAPEGYLDKAIAHTERAAQFLEGQAAHADELYNDGIRALVYLRRGEGQRAWEMAAKTISALTQEPSLALQLFEGCASVAEVCLTLWETGNDSLSVDGKMLAQMASRACKVLRNYARNLMYGRPRAYLWQGLYHWLAGKPRRAHKLWQKALGHARALEMPYEQALAYYQIGRHLEVDDPAREEHLGRAAEMFCQLQAAYDQAQIQAVREGGSGD